MLGLELGLILETGLCLDVNWNGTLFVSKARIDFSFSYTGYVMVVRTARLFANLWPCRYGFESNHIQFLSRLNVLLDFVGSAR